MISRTILSFAFLCLFFFTQAQPPLDDLTPRDATMAPVGITETTMIDQLMMVVPGVGSNSRLSQERQNLKPYMMPVRHCAAGQNDWSYMLATTLEYYVNLNRNFKDNLSPDFIQLSLRSSGRQPSMEEGLLFLASQGTISAAIMPYGSPQIPNAVYAAAKHKITNFLHVFSSFANSREKTFEVRKALMRGNPVVVEFRAGANFKNLRATNLWEPDGQLDRSYTLVAVGFDETMNAFEVMSCWGNEWANNGYMWVNYNDFANAAINGYVIVPQ